MLTKKDYQERIKVLERMKELLKDYRGLCAVIGYMEEIDNEDYDWFLIKMHEDALKFKNWYCSISNFPRFINPNEKLLNSFYWPIGDKKSRMDYVDLQIKHYESLILKSKS